MRAQPRREKGFVEVRAAFVAQCEAAEAMQPRQGAFDNPAEDAEAAAMRTAGLGGPWTLPAPWTPRTRPLSLLVITLRTDKIRRACARLGLTRYSQPLPLAGFQTAGDTLRSGRRRIHETTIERQDASAIHRLTPRRPCEDDRDGARTREQAHSARLRRVPRLGHDRLDDLPVSISRHLQQAADLLRRPLVAEELLLALPDGRVLECESARAAEAGVQSGGEEARYGEVLRSFRVAGRFAARSDWQADLGDFGREVDRDVRTIALDDQGGAGADGEAKRPLGGQGGGQERRKKATAVNCLPYKSSLSIRVSSKWASGTEPWA